jgi:hypothetical protein
MHEMVCWGRRLQHRLVLQLLLFHLFVVPSCSYNDFDFVIGPTPLVGSRGRVRTVISSGPQEIADFGPIPAGTGG